MDNIWKDFAKDYMSEDKFERVCEEIKNSKNVVDVNHEFSLNSFLSVVSSKEDRKVGMRIKSGYQNAFDVCYKNKKPIINEEDFGSIDLIFDNKLSIENFIEVAQIVLKAYDEITEESDEQCLN
ncbi:hypothetical protein MTW73_08120 [Staphylococcus haemolyticus]|uniref:hypothetical protein n=1 Tax=Staphylococcus haemolyticus TaxID=1283 RepID=UPI001FB34C76|nr:hypothetical protein [Staphylococcus haemolyticus]MCJ0960326.1 hypothetical protein [Staphylococcus haemolyticus]